MIPFIRRVNPPWKLMTIALVSAALMVLSFPSYSVWWLAFFGITPFLYALMRSRSFTDAAWVGLTFMMAFVILGFGWISFVSTNFGGLPWIVGKFVLLCYSIFGESQFFILALTVFAVRRFCFSSSSKGRLSSLVWCLGLPLFYTGLDWIYPKIFPSSFGNVLYSWLSVAQLAEYTGVFGLALPILLVNFSLLVLINNRILKKRFSKHALELPVSERWAKAVLAVVAVFFVSAHFWGVRRIEQVTEMEKTYSRPFKFSVIQANIGDLDKLASERGYYPAIEKVLSTYESMSIESAKRFHPDLVVWPENAYPFLYLHHPDYSSRCKKRACDQWMMDLATQMNTTLFFGTYSQQGRQDFNSAFLIGPHDKLYGIYLKHVLLAFGEYVPLGPLSPYILELLPMIANFGRGPGPTLIDLNGVKLAPQICYEGLVSDHVRQGVLKGADLMLNITNDSWFGAGTEPWLHLWLTAFRTIEVRRPLLRATNTGISTLIDSTGEMRWRTRLFESATLESEVRLPAEGQEKPLTFYARHGDLFSEVCGLLGVICLALGCAFPLFFKA